MHYFAQYRCGRLKDELQGLLNGFFGAPPSGSTEVPAAPIAEDQLVGKATLTDVAQHLLGFAVFVMYML